MNSNNKGEVGEGGAGTEGRGGAQDVALAPHGSPSSSSPPSSILPSFHSSLFLSSLPPSALPSLRSSISSSPFLLLLFLFFLSLLPLPPLPLAFLSTLSSFFSSLIRYRLVAVLRCFCSLNRIFFSSFFVFHLTLAFCFFYHIYIFVFWMDGVEHSFIFFGIYISSI